MTSSFYTTTWIDVELRTHCKVRGYQDSNYHRTGSEDLLIGDPFTPRYDLKFPHLAAIIFCLGPIIINLRQGEREWGGGGKRERRGGEGGNLRLMHGCVIIIIYNNKLLMLCSIM